MQFAQSAILGKALLQNQIHMGGVISVSPGLELLGRIWTADEIIGSQGRTP